MAISKKIHEQLKKECKDEGLKTVLLDILEHEDKGIHRYKEVYEKIICDYINRKGNE